MLERIILKLTSARFLIAVILTIVFAIMAYRGNIATEFITVYGMIITFYFSKDRTNSNNE